MLVEFRAIASLRPCDTNPRSIPDAAVAKVAASIERFGWRQPVVVDGDGVVVAGHVRLLAARRLGLTEVPVHVASDLSPEEVRAYRLADNRSAEEAAWDHDLLAGELAALDLDLRAATGFEDVEIDRLLGAMPLEDGAPPESATEEVDVDGFDLPHTCPRCGFSFDDRGA